MQNISQNIKLARKAKGWTQQQMADELFITRQAVSNWETGKAMPDLPTLEKAAEKLDVDISTLLYGEKTLKGYTEQIILKIIKYWAILIVFLATAEFLSFDVLDRVSEYAGYNVVIEYPVWSWAVVFYSYILFFIWIILWRLSNIVERYGKSARKVLISVTVVFAGITIVITAFSAMRHWLYTYDRYNHIVKLGDERYEITDIDYISVYNYHDMGYCGGSKNRIIYIDSMTDYEADAYINDIVTGQPLKIERITEEKAVHFMYEYHIEKAPAVVIVSYENAEVLEGIEEISLLEWKIHNYKQHNIFFY